MTCEIFEFAKVKGPIIFPLTTYQQLHLRYFIVMRNVHRPVVTRMDKSGSLFLLMIALDLHGQILCPIN